MTEDDHMPEMPDLIPDAVVMQSMKMSLPELLDLAKAGEFPAPLRFGKLLRWDKEDVYAALYRRYEAAAGVV
jgi:predicted DNA-binding transcriptional regulator AlpA